MLSCIINRFGIISVWLWQCVDDMCVEVTLQTSSWIYTMISAYHQYSEDWLSFSLSPLWPRAVGGRVGNAPVNTPVRIGCHGLISPIYLCLDVTTVWRADYQWGFLGFFFLTMSLLFVWVWNCDRLNEWCSLPLNVVISVQNLNFCYYWKIKDRDLIYSPNRKLTCYSFFNRQARRQHLAVIFVEYKRQSRMSSQQITLHITSVT